MTQSIIRIEVGVSSASEDTLKRSREIIDQLKERHEVTGEEPIWRVTYIDFDTPGCKRSTEYIRGSGR